MRDGRTGRFASGFEKGSAGSYPATTSSISRASGTPFAKTVMQSRVRHAGTSPAVLQRPLLGLKPSRWLKEAGTRPEPAVSRSEEHTSELQSLMRTSYAAFSLTKKIDNKHREPHEHETNTTTQKDERHTY